MEKMLYIIVFESSSGELRAVSRTYFDAREAAIIAQKTARERNTRAWACEIALEPAVKRACELAKPLN